jgi:transposase-like protein
MAGSRRRSKEERRRVVAAYRLSGLSRAAFARLRGVSVASLSRWCAEAGGYEGPPVTKRGGFVEVVAPSATVRASDQGTAVLWLGESVSLELTSLPLPEYVAMVARAYEALSR